MKLRPCFVVLRDRSILSSCVHLRGTFSGPSEPYGAPYEPLRTCEERFLAQKTLFLLALASAKRIGELTLCRIEFSHTRDWGEVSFAFVTGFVAKTQDPSSLLLGLRALQYRP